MRKTVVVAILFSVAIVAGGSLTWAADTVTLLAAVYSPGDNHTTYSYMLKLDPSHGCTVGQTFALVGVAPVIGVGDPVYWHDHEVEEVGNGAIVRWRCDTQPPENGHIFATFDLIVAGKAGEDFVEDNVTWQLEGDINVEGQVIGPVPLGGWIPTGFTGKITGIVYYDADQDATCDSDELLLEGIQISVLNSSGAELYTATTDANGAFEFDEVPEGTYIVKMVLANGEVRYVVVTTGNADGETVQIQGEEEKHVEFGLYLNTCLIAQDASDGTITGDGLSKGYWAHQVMLAIYCKLRESGDGCWLPGGWRAIIGSWWDQDCSCGCHHHSGRDRDCSCGSDHRWGQDRDCSCDCHHRSRSRSRHHRHWCIVSEKQVLSLGATFVDMQCHRRHHDRNRKRCPRPPRCPRPRPVCPPSEDVVGILTQVEQLWIVDPFQFADGENDEPVGLAGLIEALKILKGYADLCTTDCDTGQGDDDCVCQCSTSSSLTAQCHDHHSDHRDRCRPCRPRCRIRPRLCWKAKLARQLLAAEMNWVTERRSSLGRLEEWLLWYAEWAYNNECKAQTTEAGECLPGALDALNNLGD